MKVNAELFEQANKLVQFGIPVFLGIPVVSSLIHLAENFDLKWYQMIEGPTHGDFEVDCSSDRIFRNDAIHGPLDHDDLLRAVDDQSRVLGWSAAIEVMRSKRPAERYGFRFPFGVQYKPVYFLFW